jgi:hypothetical protein
LEVERLARALSAYWANRYGKDDVSARMELNRPAAEELAREYAALSDDVSPGVEPECRRAPNGLYCAVHNLPFVTPDDAHCVIRPASG